MQTMLTMMSAILLQAVSQFLLFTLKSDFRNAIMKTETIRRKSSMILDQLRQLDHLTDQEKALVSFILENSGQLENMNGKQLADACFVSASGVTRLCQKLGFKGYPDFKIRLVSELHDAQNNRYADVSVSLIDKPASAQKTMEAFYSRVIYENNCLISQAKLMNVCQRMRQASVIDIYGTGMNYYQAETAAFHFRMLGYTACALSAVNAYAITAIQKDSPHLSFIISHTGNNPSMVTAAKMLQRHGQPVIAITQLDKEEDNTLAKYSNIVLPIYATKEFASLHALSFPISVGYVFNLIFYTLLAMNPSGYENNDAMNFYHALLEIGRKEDGKDGN